MARKKLGASRKEYPFEYHFCIKRNRGKAKRIIAQGGETFAEVDSKIRNAFKYDTWDHCSGFWEKEAYGGRALAEIYPDGSGLNQDVPIGEFGLVPGMTLSYVYDFGDDLRHVVTVEDLGAARRPSLEQRV